MHHNLQSKARTRCALDVAVLYHMGPSFTQYATQHVKLYTFTTAASHTSTVLGRHRPPGYFACRPLQPKKSQCNCTVINHTLTAVHSRVQQTCLQGGARSVDDNPASAAFGDSRRRQEGQGWQQHLRQKCPGTALGYCTSPAATRYTTCPSASISSSAECRYMHHNAR